MSYLDYLQKLEITKNDFQPINTRVKFTITYGGHFVRGISFPKDGVPQNILEAVHNNREWLYSAERFYMNNLSLI
jgi:hypothetical protein